MSSFKAVFNGYSLQLYKDGNIFKSWDAISGNAGYQSPIHSEKKHIGPIPSGKWTLDTSKIQTITGLHDAVGTYIARNVYDLTGKLIGRYPGGFFSWGLERVDLVPELGTNTLGRTSFTLHGGDKYGSAGCIDLGHGEVDFFKTVTELGVGTLSLEVSYDPRLLSEDHPLAGQSLGSRFKTGEAPPLDHRGKPIGFWNCFLAGTQITMANGSEVRIEEIEVGAVVSSFSSSKAAELRKGRVVKIFRSVSNYILDLRGVYCTPGHYFLRGAMPSADGNQFYTIACILRDDGAIIGAAGTEIRARTGAHIEMFDDALVAVVYQEQAANGGSGAVRQALVRAGIPMPATSCANGKLLMPASTLAHHLEVHGIIILSDGSLRTPDGTHHAACNWPEGSTPFDTHEARNWIVEADGQPYTPPWIRDLVEEDEQQGLRVVGALPTISSNAAPANLL